VITELARDTESWHDPLRLVDSTPLPCAASRETVRRSDLAGHAGYGYCASHSRWFWGFRLYLVTTAEGMPVIWGLAHPGLGEREVAAALFTREHYLVRAGQVILGDKGFAGRDSEPRPGAARQPTRQPVPIPASPVSTLRGNVAPGWPKPRHCRTSPGGRMGGFKRSAQYLGESRRFSMS